MKSPQALSACVISLFLTVPPAQGLTAQPYGFVKASLVAASRAVDSFGNPNLSAPTKALPNDAGARSSFQLSQTRVGMRLNEKERASATLELDFIDFTKASPVVKAVPRLRIASIQYQIDEAQKIQIGQDWDVFSPGRPSTYNYIGLYFGTGNAGFMRPQAKYIVDRGNFHVETALGLGGLNATASDGDLELNVVPSFGAQLKYRLSQTAFLGVSGIGGRIRFGASGPAYGSFYGLNAFGEMEPWSGGTLKGEAYYGQNLGNSGALTLAAVTSPGALHEAGGYLTLQQALSSQVKLVGGVGTAAVLEDEGGAAIGSLHPLANSKLAVAVAYQPTENLDFFVEDSLYVTRYRNASGGGVEQASADVLDVGAVYLF